MPAARWWKTFYEEERAQLGERAIDEMLDAAPTIEPSAPGRALVFPHTRLAVSGTMVASVARAVVSARCDRVLAIGVLHGGRESDAALVARARAGDPGASTELRRVHTEDGLAAEEFSLDGFRAVLARAAERAKTKAPIVLARYPFLVDEDPESVPGFDALTRERERAMVVATTDPVHHGIGYGTPADRAKSDADSHTLDLARKWISGQLGALAAKRYSEFATLCDEHRSDFRDAGPTLAALVPDHAWSLDDLVLVDYADVLGAPRPTWVAAGAISVLPRS